MSDMLDRLAIRELVEHWAMWRDARLWDRFRTVWHEDGQMWATWFQGTAEEFIRVSQDGYDRGVRVLHMLGGIAIEVAGHRAVAQTKASINQRGPVDGVLCDVTCLGRFYDFIERRPVENGHGGWGIVRRRLVYEQDRIDPVDPAATLRLDQDLLAQFPVGYRHLAYLQSRIGLPVKRDLPGLDGPELDALYAAGAAWLNGQPLT
jgi:hypothetical protein